MMENEIVMNKRSIEEDDEVIQEGEPDTKHRRLTVENVPSSGAVTMEKAPHIPKPAVDRKKICPMYIRMFCRMNGHHKLDDFSKERQPLEDELIIYTWKDATLRELSDLIKQVNIESRRRDARFSFQLIYQDTIRGGYRSKQLGVLLNNKSRKDDLISLEDVRFVQGDFIDVAIYFGPILIRPSNPMDRSATSEHRFDNRFGRRNSSDRTFIGRDNRAIKKF